MSRSRVAPQAIVDKLNAGINAARAMPDVVQKLKDLGFSLAGPGPRPEETAEFVKSEMELWVQGGLDLARPGTA